MKRGVHPMLTGLPVVALALAGCGDDTDSGSPQGGSSGPLYAITSQVFSPDFSSSTGAINFASSYAAGTMIDQKKSIEVGSSAVIAGVDLSGKVYSVNTDTGTITKYFVDDKGIIQQGETLTLSAYGISSFVYPVLYVFSDKKAYLWDNVTLQAFVFDPSTMTISKRVDMKGQFDPVEMGTSYAPFMENDPIKIGSKLYMAFNYWNRTSFAVLPRSGMFVIDTDTDTFAVAKHPTCGGLMASMLGPDGFIYTASAGHQAAGWIAHLPGNNPPCMVRFDTKKGDFDPSYNVDLTQLTGGAAVSGVVPSSGAFGYFRVFNKDLAAKAPMDNALVLSTVNAWELYRMDVTKPMKMTKVDARPSPPTLYVTITEGRNFITDIDWTKNQTTLLDLSSDPPTRSITGQGLLLQLFRMK